MRAPGCRARYGVRHARRHEADRSVLDVRPVRARPAGAPWFADLESRLDRAHCGVSRRLRQHLGASPNRPQFVHAAVMGHPGTGKTTLVRRALMLQHSCVLQYDGTPWWDVHPAIQRDELFLAAARRRARESEGEAPPP